MEAALFAFGDVIIWITRLIVVGIAVYGLLTKNLLLFTIGISGMGGGILGWSICEVLIGNRLYGLLCIFGGLLLIWGGAAYREWCYKNNRVTQITFLLTPVRKRDPIVKGPNEKEEEYMDREVYHRIRC